MRKVIALILAGGHGKRLGVLTEKIAKPAVPFGGKYRLIDFTLSNCVNSGIYNIGVLTQYRPHILNNHIGIGKPWDLDRKKGGVTILPPFLGGMGGWYKGTADAVFQNMEFVDRFNPDFVVILSGDHVYAMDYNDMVDFHISNGAEATIACIEVPITETSRFGIIVSDPSSKIIEFQEKPSKPKSNLASLGIYVFNWKFLKEYLERDGKDKTSNHDFGHDVIPKMLKDGRNLYSYRFSGYWRDVGTIKSYWESNIELTKPVPPLNLYDANWRFYTQTEEMSPAYCDPNAVVISSIISEGCEISGGVENSVIFQGVKVGNGCVIRNSIVMTNSVIEDNSTIENAIIAENVFISKNVKIGVGENAPNQLDSNVYAGDITVVGMEAKIPQGTVVGKNCVIGIGVNESDFESLEIPSGSFVLHKE